MRYAVVDLSNLFHRARHVVTGDIDTIAGMTMLIVFRSLKRLYKDHSIDHAVICVDNGRSWRYDLYPAYKAKRRADRLLATPEEKEIQAVFMQSMNTFIEFLTDKTRCTILNHPTIEGDDFIGRWIQLHPDDEHIILSSDSDFVQLLSDKVMIYDGIEQRLISSLQVLNDKQQPMVFSIDTSKAKIKVGMTVEAARKLHDLEQKKRLNDHVKSERERGKIFLMEEDKRNKLDPSHQKQNIIPKLPPDEQEFSFEPEQDWPQKALFLKIIRGDKGDGIFGAYPGVRMKGSSKSPGLEEAWADRHDRTYFWNNIMGHEWEKLDTVTSAITRVVVRDEYAINEQLIDLTKQSDSIKAIMDEAIAIEITRETRPPAGIPMMQFCSEHRINSLLSEVQDHTRYLNTKYQGALLD